MAEPSVWRGSDEFRLRNYDSYESYVEHQSAKLKTLDLERYNASFRPALIERLRSAELLMRRSRGTNVLCLGARNGIECEAFIALGHFAVGIDLNPGASNRYVVTGDFHAPQFADATVDVVFTNTLDHAFEFETIVREVRRVLKPDGILIAEIVRGSKDERGREPGLYESAWWDKSGAVVDRLEKGGFAVQQTTPFDRPWVGDQFVLVPVIAQTRAGDGRMPNTPDGNAAHTD